MKVHIKSYLIILNITEYYLKHSYDKILREEERSQLEHLSTTKRFKRLKKERPFGAKDCSLFDGLKCCPL